MEKNRYENSKNYLDKKGEKSLRLDMTNTVDFDSLSSTKVIFQNK